MAIGKSSSTGRSSTRRAFLAAGAAGIAATAGCTGSAEPSDDTIKIGVLEDRSGGFALNGTSKWQTSVLAVEEINESGGILGKEIELFDPDPQSDNQRYQELTRRLIQRENVDALWAGYSSAARETIRPLINQYEQLYFYTTQYEGGVCDETIFPVGATARQQLGAVVPHLIEEYGPRIYTIAADYNFGQISGDWVRILAEENGAEVIGEEFIPLDVSQFGSTINRIQEADPDFVMSMLVGQNHTSFYNQRASAGLDIPIGSSTTMAQGYEHRRLNPPALADMYVGVNYMQEVDTEASNTFVERFYERWPDAPYLNQEAQNNYFSIHMYAEAAERAGTTDQEAVIEELEKGMEIEAPEGTIELDGATHHMNHHMRIGHADRNHDLDFGNEQYIGAGFLREVGCSLPDDPETTQYLPAEVYDL